MKAAMAVIATVVLLAGCAASSPQPSHPRAAPASPTPAFTPITETFTPPPPAALTGARLGRCQARFHAWLHGPVHYEVFSMENSLHQFNLESGSSIYAAVTFLNIAGNAAKLAGTWPIPRCADPAGYWPKFLDDVTAESTDAGTPAQTAAQGYMPDAAISDSKRAQSALSALSAELESRIERDPFG